MGFALSREIGKPDGSTVSIERKASRIRVADADGENVRTITREQIEEAAMRVIGLPDIDHCPRHLAETLAYAALAASPLTLVSSNHDLPTMPLAEEAAARPVEQSKVPALPLPDVFELCNRALQLSRVSETNKSGGELQREARNLLAQLVCVPNSQITIACRHLCEAVVEYAASPEKMQAVWAFAVAGNAQLLRSIVKDEREGRRS